LEPQPAAQCTVRFGLFEADLRVGELRKQGRTIKLQEQPFQVLAMLLRQPGEVVTREQLQQALWPADTFVEFDQGLNTAVKKIRQALGDSADNPRFVETIPRKGYRFIAPVSGAEVAAPPPVGRHRRPFLALAAAGASIAVAAAAWWLRPGNTSRPEPVPVPFTSYPGNEISPTFSPDGNEVAFAWNTAPTMEKKGNFDIYVKQIGGGDPVRLTRDPADEYFPAWSPDGRSIAFLRALTPEHASVLLIPARGGRERKLAEVCQADFGAGSFLSWFPDGKQLMVVDKESASGPFSLFLLSVETGEKRKLTAPPHNFIGDQGSAVAPDGCVVVFSRFSSEDDSDLFLLELSESAVPTSEPRRITLEKHFTAGLAWTADSRSIVFASGQSHSPSLWKLDLSRGLRPGKLQRLAFAGQGVADPTISRQGRLVYEQFNVDVDVLRLDVDGDRQAQKPAVRLISSTRLDHDARYSHDGKRIAFCSNRSGSLALWVCDSDGSNAAQLTSFGSSYYTTSPRWSPDSRSMAFGSNVGGKPGVSIISSDGGRPKTLAIEGFLESSQSEWSRNGKWIYCGSNRSGEPQLWKTPVAGGQAIQVTRKGFSLDATESADGQFVYYLKGPGAGQNTLWKMPVQGGQETQVLDSVLNDNFAVTGQGIYFMPKSEPAFIQFSSFVTGKVTTIARVPHKPAWGFSVSPDSRWLLYSEYEAMPIDLMLVENFH
jgi:Tol biopolymer transport system component/DNA-binding winged helix-turn-helix (wHTH) protein